MHTRIYAYPSARQPSAPHIYPLPIQMSPLETHHSGPISVDEIETWAASTNVDLNSGIVGSVGWNLGGKAELNGGHATNVGGVELLVCVREEPSETERGIENGKRVVVVQVLGV
jgi:hypothetical protein